MSVLFEKTNIKSMELKNRLVRSATHEGMADSDGFPTRALFKLYERLARGGVGLIITGYAFVSLDGKSPFIGMQGIDEVSCGIMEDGNSLARGDLPLDVFIKEWDMYKRKDPIFKFIMKRFGEKIVKPLPYTPAYNLESAMKIKGRLNIPVFVVGGLAEPKTMKEIVEKGSVDYVSLCRALIADPKFPEKISAGSHEPSRCIHCNLCIGYMYSRPLRCYHGKRLQSK